jgi:hypothetical protein
LYDLETEEPVVFMVDRQEEKKKRKRAYAIHFADSRLRVNERKQNKDDIFN